MPFNLNAFKESVVQEFETINDALNELLISGKFFIEKSDADIKISELQYALQKQRESLKQCKKAAELYKRKAEWMYVHFADVNNAFEFAKEQFMQNKGRGVVMYNKRFGQVTLTNIDFKTGKAKIEFEDEQKKI